MFPKKFVSSLMILLWLSACSSEPELASRASAVTVSTQTLVLEPSYQRSRVFTGRIEAARRSDVGFELGGQLKAVAFDEGDVVQAGALLASLDTARLEASRAEAAAGLAQAKAQAILAASTQRRIAEALAFRGVSQQELDEADNALAAANAAHQASQSRLRRIDVDLGKAKLLAPYDAIITRRFSDEGQILGAGQPVFTIQEAAAPQARIGIAGDALGELQIGQPYTLLVGGQQVDATLRAVMPLRDDVAQTVDALLDIHDDQAVILRAGDLARLTLEQHIDEAGFWVPLGSLTEGNRGLWSSYAVVQTADRSLAGTHRVEARAVDVIYQDAERAFVRGTLVADEAIITDGLHRIVPGQSVRLTETKTAHGTAP